MSTTIVAGCTAAFWNIKLQRKISAQSCVEQSDIYLTFQGAIVGSVLGFCVTFTLGIGNAIYNPWPLSLNSSVENCPDNVTISDWPLQGK